MNVVLSATHHFPFGQLELGRISSISDWLVTLLMYTTGILATVGTSIPNPDHHQPHHVQPFWQAGQLSPAEPALRTCEGQAGHPGTGALIWPNTLLT